MIINKNSIFISETEEFFIKSKSVFKVGKNGGKN